MSIDREETRKSCQLAASTDDADAATKPQQTPHAKEIAFLRAVTDPQELLRFCQDARKGLASADPFRQYNVWHSPVILREVWDAMDRIGPAVPPAPALLDTDDSAAAFAGLLLGEPDKYARPTGAINAFNLAIAWCDACAGKVLNGSPPAGLDKSKAWSGESEGGGLIAKGDPSKAAWLPAGWTAAVYPTRLEPRPIARWLEYAIWTAAILDRPDLHGSHSEFSPSYAPLPRDLVAHAFLIFRHLRAQYPDAPHEPNSPMDRAGCVAELRKLHVYILDREPAADPGKRPAGDERSEGGRRGPGQPRLSSVEEKRRLEILQRYRQFMGEPGIKRGRRRKFLTKEGVKEADLKAYETWKRNTEKRTPLAN